MGVSLTSGPLEAVSRLQFIRIPIILAMHQVSPTSYSCHCPKLSVVKIPPTLHPNYCDTTILMLLYPQTPIPGPLCLRNSTLEHLASKSCSQVTDP